MRLLRFGLIFFLLLFAVLGAFAFDGGDTGTYRILSYKVVLSPKPDGTVAIDYYQKWLVTGGDIPWITIGTPNPNYTISSHSPECRATNADNGDWYGVRLDLKKDYKPGETFEVRLRIIQWYLFSESDSGYRLDFTPGWYDRAVVKNLHVQVLSSVDMTKAHADPEPSSRSKKELTWDRKELLEGGKLPISVKFPKAAFPKGVSNSEPPNQSSSAASRVALFFSGFAIFIIALLTALGRYALLGSLYSGGSIYYGGRRGGGCVYSCACACVSCACACACACAGGGGAGCTRKTSHSCPACRKKDEDRQDGTSESGS